MEELLNIREMKSRCWFIEDIEGFLKLIVLRDQRLINTLCFSSREGWSRLSGVIYPSPTSKRTSSTFLIRGNATKNSLSLFYRHSKNFGNILSLESDFECFLIVSSTMAFDHILRRHQEESAFLFSPLNPHRAHSVLTSY